MPLNERLLRIAVANQGEKVLVSKVRPFVELDYQVKKEQFLNEFDANPINQEIAAGPNATTNVSALSNSGGNLFSFLGFKSSQSPITALRNYFQNNIVLGRTRAGTVRGRKIIFSTPVNFPTIEETNSFIKTNGDTKLQHWTRSFAQILEKGIPGLPKYLFSDDPPFKKSRSGTGIQIKGSIKGRPNMPQLPYLSEIVGKLKAFFTSNRR